MPKKHLEDDFSHIPNVAYVSPLELKPNRVLIGLGVAAIVIALGTLGYLLVDKLFLGESATAVPNIEITKKSPTTKVATPNAQKAETADWKVINVDQVGIQFKVPQGWVITESSGTTSNGKKINISVTAKNQDLEKKVVFTVNRNPLGGLSLDKTREETTTIDGYEATRVYFQDRQDFPGASLGEHTWVIWPILEISGVKYDISAQWTVGDEESLELLNRILKTLKFLD